MDNYILIFSIRDLTIGNMTSTRPIVFARIVVLKERGNYLKMIETQTFLLLLLLQLFNRCNVEDEILWAWRHATSVCIIVVVVVVVAGIRRLRFCFQNSDLFFFLKIVSDDFCRIGTVVAAPSSFLSIWCLGPKTKKWPSRKTLKLKHPFTVIMTNRLMMLLWH